MIIDFAASSHGVGGLVEDLVQISGLASVALPGLKIGNRVERLLTAGSRLLPYVEALLYTSVVIGLGRDQGARTIVQGPEVHTGRGERLLRPSFPA
jgi:hypothetical protein